MELTRRSLLAGPGRLSRHEIPKQLDGISAQRAGNRDKLDDVDAPLATLILGDKGLGPAKFLRQRALADTRFMSRCDKESTSRAYSADLRDFCMYRRA